MDISILQVQNLVHVHCGHSQIVKHLNYNIILTSINRNNVAIFVIFIGGWANPLIVDWFADYARIVYDLYADRVKIFMTLNEPTVFCDFSFNTGIHAPGVVSTGIGNYLCNKHVLLAHAKAWRIYDKEFRPKYNGKR